MPALRFFQGLRERFTDPERIERLARMAEPVDELGPMIPAEQPDPCVTDVVPAPYAPVRATSLPQVAWPDAVPDWDDLTADEHADHRAWCADGCSLCADHRQWGVCPACGHGNAEAHADGSSACCGARVLFGAEADRAWAL